MTTLSANVLAQSPLAWATEVAPVQLYPYQAALLADRSPRIAVAKSRQIGASTAAQYLAAHTVLHKPRSVVLVVSADQTKAADFSREVVRILEDLDEPPDFKRKGALAFELANGSRCISQPATAKAGRGYRADLAILDEFGFADYDSLILRAVQPALSRGGRLIVISTPNGVGNVFYRIWHEESGWSKHRIHYSQCPAFPPAWAEQEREKHTAQSWASEYEIDFSVSGLAVFNAEDVDAMAYGYVGEQSYREGHMYVTGVDVGRRRDPSVLITLDATAPPYPVVRFERILKAPFAVTQEAIRRRAELYPNGRIFVEANNTGDPVIEALMDSGVWVTPFQTTAQSKSNGLMRLVRLIETNRILANQEQLLSELRSYQWDDARLVQDCVMALMIAASGVIESPGSTAAINEEWRRQEEEANSWDKLGDVDVIADETEGDSLWRKVF